MTNKEARHTERLLELLGIKPNPCPRCNGRKSVSEHFPVPAGQPLSLPVSIDCPDCVKRCACGRTNKYRAFEGGSCGRCAS